MVYDMDECYKSTLAEAFRCLAEYDYAGASERFEHCVAIRKLLEERRKRCFSVPKKRESHFGLYSNDD